MLNLDLAQHVSTISHLGNIAYRSGQKIVWDTANEKVVGGGEADGQVGVQYRDPWKLPYLRRG